MLRDIAFGIPLAQTTDDGLGDRCSAVLFASELFRVKHGAASLSARAPIGMGVCSVAHASGSSLRMGMLTAAHPSGGILGSCKDAASLSVAISIIVSRSAKKEMVRTAATPIVTAMEEAKSLGDPAFEEVIGETMGALKTGTGTELPIPVGVDNALPLPAPVNRLIYLGPKPLFERKAVAHTMLYHIIARDHQRHGV